MTAARTNVVITGTVRVERKVRLVTPMPGPFDEARRHARRSIRRDIAGAIIGRTFHDLESEILEVKLSHPPGSVALGEILGAIDRARGRLSEEIANHVTFHEREEPA